MGLVIEMLFKPKVKYQNKTTTFCQISTPAPMKTFCARFLKLVSIIFAAQIPTIKLLLQRHFTVVKKNGVVLLTAKHDG